MPPGTCAASGPFGRAIIGRQRRARSRGSRPSPSAAQAGMAPCTASPAASARSSRSRDGTVGEAELERGLVEHAGCSASGTSSMRRGGSARRIVVGVESAVGPLLQQASCVSVSAANCARRLGGRHVHGVAVEPRPRHRRPGVAVGSRKLADDLRRSSASSGRRARRAARATRASRSRRRAPAEIGARSRRSPIAAATSRSKSGRMSRSNEGRAGRGQHAGPIATSRIRSHIVRTDFCMRRVVGRRDDDPGRIDRQRAAADVTWR